MIDMPIREKIDLEPNFQKIVNSISQKMVDTPLREKIDLEPNFQKTVNSISQKMVDTPLRKMGDDIISLLPQTTHSAPFSTFFTKTFFLLSLL